MGEIAYVLHQTFISVVTGEWRASEVSRHLGAFYFLDKR